MEKIINGNDVYFLEVLDNKIIINDNYEGIIVLDHEINVLRKIKLFEGIYIYSSFVTEKNELLLFCPEDNKVVYVDVENKQVYIIDIPTDFESEILSRMISSNSDRYIFVTNRNKYIVLDKKRKEIKRIYDASRFDELAMEKESKLLNHNNNTLQMYKDCNNRDVRDDISADTYEDKIVICNNKKIREICPKEGYIFNNAKIVNIHENLYLVTLSNKKANDEISILSVININDE